MPARNRAARPSHDPRDMIRKLLAYFAGAGAYVLAGRAMQLLMFLTIARTTDVETMGIFVTSFIASQLIGTFSTLGLGAASQKVIPAAQARGRSGHILIFLQGFVLALMAMTVLIMALLAVLWKVGPTLGLSLSDSEIAGLMIFVPIIAISINREQLARAFGDIGLAFAPRDILWSAAMIALVLSVSIRGVAILWVAGGTLLVIEMCAVLLLVHRHVAPLRTARVARLRFRRKWLREGLAFVASSLGGQGFERIDTLYVASAFSVATAGVYGLCSRIAPITSLCQRFIVPVLLRRFSAELARGNLSAVRQDLLLGLAAAAIFASPLLVGVLLFGEHLLLLFGPEYVAGAPVLVALTLAQVAIAVGSNFGALVLCSPRPGLYGRVILTTAGITLTALLVLQPQNMQSVAWLISGGIVAYNTILIFLAIGFLRRHPSMPQDPGPL